MLNKKEALLLVFLFTALMAGKVIASTSEEGVKRGLEIAQEAKKRNVGWAYMTASLEMTLRNAHGEESRRLLQMKTLEIADDGDKSLITFVEPADVKGTVLLTHARISTSDDQWIFFPNSKRVKRISSTNKSGPFMGSEFSYEDMSPWEIEKYRYRFLGNDTVDGVDVYLLEMIPVYAYSGYTKQVSKIDTKEYKPLEVNYYDRKGSLLKTQVYSGYEKYIGRYWRASKMEMVNHQTKKTTELDWKNYQFKPYSAQHEAEFTKESMSYAQW